MQEEFDAQIHLVLTHIPVSNDKLEEIKHKTNMDEQLKVVRTQIIKGWPKNKEQVPKIICEY